MSTDCDRRRLRECWAVMLETRQVLDFRCVIQSVRLIYGSRFNERCWERSAIRSTLYALLCGVASPLAVTCAEDGVKDTHAPSFWRFRGAYEPPDDAESFAGL